MQRDYVKEMKDQYNQIMAANKPDGDKQKVSLSFCPTTWNKPCKLCDSCKEILWHKDKHTAQEVEMAGEFNRKPKFYANVVLATNPTEVLLFEYGKTIADKLGVYEMDEGSELKGFSHPYTGRNIIIVKYPNPDKRKTRYDVEPRLVVSPLPDVGVIQRLYNLDDVPSLLASGVQPLYQSKLTAQRTEIRWLPSWLGAQFASVFQVKYFIHYHTSEEELALINKGELDPMAKMFGGSTSLPQPIVTGSSGPTQATMTNIRTTPATSFGGWEPPIEATKVTMSVPTTQVSTIPPKQEARPGCFGTYDEGDDLCSKKCKSLGWLEECRLETKEAIERRRAARGLYK